MRANTTYPAHPPQLFECRDITYQRGTHGSDSEEHYSKSSRCYYRNIRPAAQSPGASSTGSAVSTTEAPISQTESPPSDATSDIEYTQGKATPTKRESLSDSSTTPNNPNTPLTVPKTESPELKPIPISLLSPEQIRHEDARERLIALLDARQAERLRACDNLIALVAAEGRKSREIVQGARVSEVVFRESKCEAGWCGFRVEGRCRNCNKGCRGLPVIPDSLSVPVEGLIGGLMAKGSLVRRGEE